MKLTNQEAIDLINDEIKTETIKQGIALNMAVKALETYSEWIPVTNPYKELPKKDMLWVTINNGYETYVSTVYYDMTEWSDDISQVIAYKPYYEPEAYHQENF